MSGTFGSLHAARTGMNVAQLSIQTASHNINNQNTAGYSRQRVEQSVNTPYCNVAFNSTLGVGQIGTGVKADEIIRIRNTFYDFQYRSEAHEYAQTAIKYEHYSNIETLFNEPSDTAISACISDFFLSWQELTKSPEDLGAKDIVLQDSKYLANTISNLKSKLETFIEQAKEKIYDDVEDINTMLNRIEVLDVEIKKLTNSGRNPNDLMDERDYIIDELSEKLNLYNTDVQDALATGSLKVVEGDDGSFTVQVVQEDGTPLILTGLDGNGDLITEYQIFEDNGNKTIVIGEDATLDPDKLTTKTVSNVSGQIQGSVDMIERVTYYVEKLTELAKGIAKGVNNLLQGKDPDETYVQDLDKDLFIIDDKDGNPIITINQSIVDAPKEWSMDGELADRIYRLKDVKFGIGDDDGITIDKFYENIIQKLGNESQEVIRAEGNQAKIINEIENLRTNESGVSLDEEMVNLIQFQYSYSASAKVVTTLDTLLDVVVNGLVRF